MKIELDLCDLIEKGFSYLDVLEQVLEPAFRSEYEIAKNKVKLKNKVADAKARVANGTYTFDDLDVLAGAINADIATICQGEKYTLKPTPKKYAQTKVISTSEIDDILSSL